MADADVLALVIRHVQTVMALDELPGDARSLRLDEDLGADSLDLVELVEGVERDLRAAGHPDVHLPDDQLRGLTTVGQAADAITGALGARAEGVT